MGLQGPLAGGDHALLSFVTLHVLEAFADPRSISQGFLMKAVLILILLKAISAGVKHRKLIAEERRMEPAAERLPNP